MFILYLDESGNTGTDYDNPTQKIFTLAGLALNDKDWYDLNYKIQKYTNSKGGGTWKI